MFTRLMKLSLGLTLLLVAATGTARAGMLPVGSLSLQIDFNLNLYFILVDNFTGDPDLGGFAISPEYPVYTPMRLDNPSVTYTTLDSNGTPVEITVNLDPIFPGPLNPPDFLFFDSSVVFQSILFTASIFPDTFTASSQMYQASDVTASALLANPDGSPLQFFQNADIVVNGNPVPVDTPEPGPGLLLALGLCLCRMAVPRSRA
jgi:hypothetical protein